MTFADRPKSAQALSDKLAQRILHYFDDQEMAPDQGPLYQTAEFLREHLESALHRKSGLTKDKVASSAYTACKTMAVPTICFYYFVSKYNNSAKSQQLAQAKCQNSAGLPFGALDV